ncbi:UDP-N-acetylglucosamine 2-epimerase [bacterium]|nr:UDP-N-acetylglucosamine 2-epimerase [bacterium]
MKLLFFTGSRGEWGYIRPILEECKKKKINYKICVTNMHLLDTYGSSIKEIEKDGFKIHEKIYMALDGYNNFTMTKSLGILMSSLVDTLSRVKPDWIVLAGDRGETLIASIASAYTRIPIAHIQAGELSGIIDGQARHAIGKFTNLHFASNKDAANRLIKLGEEKSRVKLVGAPQLDDLYSRKINNTKLSYFYKKYNIDLNKEFVLAIYHPSQPQVETTKKEFKIIHAFLKTTKLNRIWISPNNDAGSLVIKNEFFKHRHSQDYIFDNLPRFDYLLLLKHCKCIVGNSSSGIIESPTFKTPCINIGDRQRGRYRAKNVIDVKTVTSKNLAKAYKFSQSKNFKKKTKLMTNPYGDGNSSKKILKFILETRIDDNLMTKKLTY